MGRFEAMDGDGVGAGSDLEAKGMRMALQDFVGTLVKRSQRRMSRWGSDKNIGGVEKVGRKVRLGGVRLGRRGKGTRKGVIELGKKVRGIMLGREGKLGRENQGRAKNSFSRGKVGGISYHTCEITDSGKNLRRESMNDVDITDVRIGWEACEGKFSLCVLKPASRVIQPKGRQGKLVLRISG
jgi:hypothetical protein